MTGHGWYEFAATFASPIATGAAATVAAIVTWIIQRRQMEISSNKLKLDLFDKRYAIFLAASDMLTYATSLVFNTSHLDVGKMAAYRLKIHEGRFLLSKSTYRHLLECIEQCDKAVIGATARSYQNVPGAHSIKDTSIDDSEALFKLERGLALFFEQELTVQVSGSKPVR